MYHSKTLLGSNLLRRRRLVGRGIVEVGEDGQGRPHDFEPEEQEGDPGRESNHDPQHGTGEDRFS